MYQQYLLFAKLFSANVVVQYTCSALTYHMYCKDDQDGGYTARDQASPTSLALLTS